MTQKGRFGKYGDLKRKEKIRQNRIFQAEHRTHFLKLERSGMTEKSKTGGHNK
ncbi:hypothetical protein [Desulforhabdus amnigena]|uniref:Uncharacterized protein n=1 Tax=Desulforhabdus amnigena TaxID=40218 RepID=A0A9W6FSQ7_9BACT|nr:hypothetical protein [Desulforhabdus amnigena]NLJ27312.1 hypothetical protein [Deltaproteobacteria bacterium]GLI34323.1 hypothetical protein DAMNIGENAA_17560 [Desulforhabdus amnigena]